MPYSYDSLLTKVIEMKGSKKAVLERLPNTAGPDMLRNKSDDRYLAHMTQCIFNAGFNWKVVEAKWAGFEEAFWGFDVHRCNFMSPDDLDDLVSNTAIVRHGTKIKSVAHNAAMILDIIEEHGSFGTWLAQWPVTDQVGLMAYLKKKGARLGGNTGQYFLRFAGYDGFILSQDVTQALIQAGVIDKPATSKRDLALVQKAFNTISEDGRYPHSHISRLLAMTIG